MVAYTDDIRSRPDQGRGNDVMCSFGEEQEIPSKIQRGDETDEAPSQQNDAWPTAEGYTPLGEMLGLGSVLVAMPPSDHDDDDENDETGGTSYYSSGVNAFVADPSALFGNAATIASDTDEQDEGITDRSSALDENTDKGIFRDLASRALSLLEEDYQMTLRGEARPSLLLDHSHEQDAPPVTRLIERSAGETSSEVKFNFANFEVSNERNNVFREQEKLIDQIGPDQLQSAAPMTTAKEVPNINTEAVRNAVAGIISDTSDSLGEKLRKWEDEKKNPQAKTRLVGHSIIPSAPLKAFRKNTPKAIQATANLTRAATIAEALNRFPTLLQSQDTINIHIVGADHVECESEDQVRSVLAPLARWIGGNIFSPRNLIVSLIGPNVPISTASIPSPTNLLSPNQQIQNALRLQSASAKCYQGSYHDWLGQEIKEKTGNFPDLVVCFNAGIWGYDEWKNSLHFLVNHKRKFSFVVTSYTIEEAEDDCEVIKEVFEAASSNGAVEEGRGCVWEPEINCFGSKVQRETKTAVEGREYRENAAWQAWRL
jgi:hypothetical protein